MTKKFGIYSIIWALAVAMFNVIVFVVPTEINGVYRLNGAFWISYAFIMASFLGQLVCSFFALKPGRLKAMFYRIPLITVSYSGLIAMLVVGTLLMAIPVSFCWVGAIVCILILGICTIAVIRASAMSRVIGNIDNKISQSTSFMKCLTDRAYMLLTSTAESELKILCKRVYEEIKYSDSVSSSQLEEINNRLLAQLSAFEEAVNGQDTELAKLEADSVLEVLTQRSLLCKRLKQN